MAFQKQINLGDNRRQFKSIKETIEDGYGQITIVSFKFKDKRFSKPVIIWGKMAEDYFLNLWRKTGWKEGDLWD